MWSRRDENLYDMNLMHQHEHHTLTIDTNNNSRQGYNNGVNIKLYTSGVQQL